MFTVTAKVTYKNIMPTCRIAPGSNSRSVMTLLETGHSSEKFKAQGDVKTLIRALHGKKDASVRQAAFEALKATIEEGNLNAHRALSDENEKMRQKALEILKQITDQNLGQDVARWQQWWEAEQRTRDL